MTLSTIERAYALARQGEVHNLAALKQRLKADGCRAVDTLLAPRSISGHLQAICAAAFKAPAEDADATSDEAPKEAAQAAE